MGFLKAGHIRRIIGIVVLCIVIGGFYENCSSGSGGNAFVLGSASTTGSGTTGISGAPPAPSPLPSPTPAIWSSISAGGEVGCGVTPGGAAWCWGDDGYGQLGDGNSGLATYDCCGNQLTAEQFSTVHVQPRGLTSGVTSISTDGSSTCAVVNAGVQCWGVINGGTLPVPVSGLTSGVTAVSVGGFACAIKNGAAYCWGDAPYGLGNGSTTLSSTPVLVSGMGSGVSAISVGGGIAACAIVNGAAKCWGYNVYGELGNGSNTPSVTPVQVTGLTAGVTSISQSGYSGCLVVNGSAECWGYNYWGNLGDGVTNTTSPYGSSNPVQVSGLTSGVASISAGSATSACAIVNGAARCWGYNADGELGNGTTTNSSVPTSVSGGTSVTMLSTGGASTCAIINNAPKCWGSNVYGALGDGSQTNSSVPMSVQ